MLQFSLRTALLWDVEKDRFLGSASSGDSKTFEPLLEEFVRSCDRQEFADISYVALQLAAHHGHTTIVHCFCSLPSSAESKSVELLMGLWNFKGPEMTSSPIHIAVRKDHVDVVDTLLSFLCKNRALLAKYTEKEWNTYFKGPLEWAIRRGHDSTVRLVVTQFKLSKVDRSLLLNVAAHHGRMKVLEVLLHDVSDYRSVVDFNLSVVHLAAQSGSLPAVELLLKKREIFNMDARSCPDLFTPLHMAANSGHADVVNLLLTSGEPSSIDLDLLLARDCIGRTALHYAVREGHERVAQELLGCAPQANIASIADYDGLLPLHLAARAGHVGLIRELRSSHVDGITSKAMHAEHMKEAVAMEYMLAGSRKNSYDGEVWDYPRPRLVDSFFWKTKGFTPLHFAIMYGHEADVRELLEQPNPDPLRTSEIVEDHGPAEAASFCKSRIDEEGKAMEELRHAWHTGTRPPLRVHIVKWLEDTEIGSVRKYWLSRAVRNGDLDLFKRLMVLFTEFQATDGDSTEYDCLALHNEAVREAFHDLAFARDECVSDVMITELRLHLPTIKLKEVVTVLLEALQNGSFEAAKEILLQVPQVALRDDAVARGVESWMTTATLWSLKEGKPFLMALVTREGLVGAPTLLRQLLTRAQQAVQIFQMEDLVEVIMDRPELKRSLYEDRQVYLDCANAILVGAALIVGIAVQGWLQPPLGYSYAYEEEQYVEVQKPLMRVFWKFNNGAFFLAVGALVAGAKGAVPVARNTDILQSVEKVKRAVAVASTFLGGVLVCVVVAFSAAGFVVLPPGGSDFRMMRNGVIWGAMPSGLALLWFCWSVLPLLDEYLRYVLVKSLTDLRPCKAVSWRTFKVLSGKSPENLADSLRRRGCLDKQSLKRCMRYILHGEDPYFI